MPRFTFGSAGGGAHPINIVNTLPDPDAANPQTLYLRRGDWTYWVITYTTVAATPEVPGSITEAVFTPRTGYSWLGSFLINDGNKPSVDLDVASYWLNTFNDTFFGIDGSDEADFTFSDFISLNSGTIYRGTLGADPTADSAVNEFYFNANTRRWRTSQLGESDWNDSRLILQSALNGILEDDINFMGYYGEEGSEEVDTQAEAEAFIEDTYAEVVDNLRFLDIIKYYIYWDSEGANALDAFLDTATFDTSNWGDGYLGEFRLYTDLPDSGEDGQFAFITSTAHFVNWSVISNIFTRTNDLRPYFPTGSYRWAGGLGNSINSEIDDEDDLLSQLNDGTLTFRADRPLTYYNEELNEIRIVVTYTPAFTALRGIESVEATTTQLGANFLGLFDAPIDYPDVGVIGQWLFSRESKRFVAWGQSNVWTSTEVINNYDNYFPTTYQWAGSIGNIRNGSHSFVNAAAAQQAFSDGTYTFDENRHLIYYDEELDQLREVTGFDEANYGTIKVLTGYVGDYIPYEVTPSDMVGGDAIALIDASYDTPAEIVEYLDANQQHRPPDNKLLYYRQSVSDIRQVETFIASVPAIPEYQQPGFTQITIGAPAIPADTRSLIARTSVLVGGDLASQTWTLEPTIPAGFSLVDTTILKMPLIPPTNVGRLVVAIKVGGVLISEKIHDWGPDESVAQNDHFLQFAEANPGGMDNHFIRYRYRWFTHVNNVVIYGNFFRISGSSDDLPANTILEIFLTR